jgi:hypothetical protein
MGQHLRGKLGPAGRIELVCLMREDGLSERAAAAALFQLRMDARGRRLRRLRRAAPRGDPLTGSPVIPEQLSPSLGDGAGAPGTVASRQAAAITATAINVASGGEID